MDVPSDLFVRRYASAIGGVCVSFADLATDTHESPGKQCDGLRFRLRSLRYGGQVALLILRFTKKPRIISGAPCSIRALCQLLLRLADIHLQLADAVDAA